MTSVPSRWQISSPYNLQTDSDVLPTLAGFELKKNKSPTFSTAIETAASGKERPRQMWSYPVWQFGLSMGVIRDRSTLGELAQLFAFFCGHAGMYQRFFVYDPYDNTVATQVLGVGDGSNKNFQLLRTISGSLGGYSFIEPVRGVLGTPVVRVNGTPTSAYTIGPNGVISFTSAPGNGLTVDWAGNFLFLCRFDQDQIDPEQLTYELWDLQTLNVRTSKL